MCAYYERMDAIYAWLDHHQFPQDLRRRVIHYFKDYLTEKAAVHESDVVNDLSPMLRNEVSNLVIHEDVRNNPVFDELPTNAIARLGSIVQNVFVDEGNSVVEEGEAGI